LFKANPEGWPGISLTEDILLEELRKRAEAGMANVRKIEDL
jgi:hypothetical protein